MKRQNWAVRASPELTEYGEMAALFKGLGVDFHKGRWSKELPKPVTRKTHSYIRVGHTYYRFDYKGRFLGWETDEGKLLFVERKE